MKSRDSICRAIGAIIAAVLGTALPASALTITLSPGASVQSIIDSNPENTTFVFRPGIYRFQSIQPKNGDNFVGTEGSILSGAEVLTTFSRQGNLWVAGGQTQQGQMQGTCDPQHPMCSYPEDLFFDGAPLLRVASLGAIVPGAWYFDYPNHQICFADNPSGHLVETSVTRSAFWGPAINVKISGLTIEKYAVPAQFGAVGDQYPGPNWTVTNNEIRWNHGAGIFLSDNSQATLNHVHHNGEKGIGGVGTNIFVEGNKVSFNNWAGFDTGWDAGGMKFAATSNLVVRGNTVHDNVGPGLWTDGGNINTLYESNVVINNTSGGGIQHEISYASIIRYNIVSGNSTSPSWLWGSQILIQNSQNAQVYGNTVDVPAAEGGNGIGIIQQSRGSGAYGPYLAINNSIHNNNIIYRGGTGETGLVADYNWTDLAMNGNNIYDYNTYHASNATSVHWVWGYNYTWTGFQTEAKQEAHGTLDTVLPPPQ